MHFTRQRTRVLAAAQLACVLTATALPRDVLYQHSHAGGDRAHVHAWNGSSVGALVAFAHEHEHAHEHGALGVDAEAHAHVHADLSQPMAAQDGSRGAARDLSRPTAHDAGGDRDREAAGDRPGVHRTRDALLPHRHTQAPFQVAAFHLSTSHGGVVPVAQAVPCPLDPAPWRSAARLRSRSPPFRLAA